MRLQVSWVVALKEIIATSRKLMASLPCCELQNHRKPVQRLLTENKKKWSYLTTKMTKIRRKSSHRRQVTVTNATAQQITDFKSFMRKSDPADIALKYSSKPAIDTVHPTRDLTLATTEMIEGQVTLNRQLLRKELRARTRECCILQSRVSIFSSRTKKGFSIVQRVSDSELSSLWRSEISESARKKS